MSDPKRATIITVGATKSEKNKVNKTVRLTINLVESNESKYPELNYKELVIAEERRKRTNIENGRNGKTNEGLDPFSDNDDDVERVARKFEQKYGGRSTYGRKGRSKTDDFADIGAGYDENDSFIDNTDGYDEMIPPECDTLYGGFYINSGSLEFKNVDPPPSDDEPRGKKNKRRISSSSSSSESSSSSSSEGSHDEKEGETANGDIRSPHRKKKNKKKEKAKKIRRTDSSAATSGKQTSDDNVHGEGESADSRTSQSDSLTSKPAPSSENPVTSDSSRDVEGKAEKEVKLPSQVSSVIEQLEAMIRRQPDKPTMDHKDLQPIIIRLYAALATANAEKRVHSAAWTRAARALHVSRTKLLQHARANHTQPPPPTTQPAAAPATNPNPAPQNNKRKAEPDQDDIDFAALTEQEREALFVETLQRLKALIDERKPAMMANYKVECERVQEERKKLQVGEGAAGGECPRRMPKRRFPWCGASRGLLARLVRLAGGDAPATLARCALPLFPAGFVRMPTLLRQADLSKELKHSDSKRPRTNSQPVLPPAPPSPPLHFPSSLTVSAVTVRPDADDKQPTIIDSYSLKQISNEKQDRDEKREDLYIPPNNIGSITITPVVNNQKPEKNVNSSSDKPKSEGLIRVKSPAALNEMVQKQEKNKSLENMHKKDKEEKNKALENIHKRDKEEKNKALDNTHKRDKEEKNKALENIHKRDKDKHRKERHHNHSTEKTNKEKRVDSPLHIDTSTKTKDEISQRQIESMRVAEGNIPRPALIPVHHSPTFAKPDKRPPEKKKKDTGLLIVSDLDPLADIQSESVVALDDSSSDVELIEDKSDKNVANASETVPSKDKVSVCEVVKDGSSKGAEKRPDEMEEATKEDFDSVMKNLRDLEHSREAPKYNNSSYGGAITSAKRDKSSSQLHSRSALLVAPQSDADKLTNFFEQNGWM